MQIAKGNVVMSLNDKDVEVFYKVVDIWTDASGVTWISLVGTLTNTFEKVPLLFTEKRFIQVSESTTKILFGSKV